MLDKVYIVQHCAALKLKAAQKYNISPEKCHIGHLLLQGMLERPNDIHQIDGATDESETNISVARRCMRLASAMKTYGLKPGDAVIIMGLNHLDLCIPFFACHFNGQSMCAIDPSIPQRDLQSIFPYVKPKLVICQKICVDDVKNAFLATNQTGEILTFDDKNNDLETFVQHYNGTEVNFRPAEFDHAKINAWLMLTSGTTGLPKVGMIPFDTLLNGLYTWWQPFTTRYQRIYAMATLQWLSSLLYFVSVPLRCFTRVQSSAPPTGQAVINIINKYKPNVTAWTPFFINQFLTAAENGLCDLSCFDALIIGGARMDKPTMDKLKKLCSAWLFLVYGMTELLVPIFKYDDDVPENSAGSPQDQYQYKLIDDDGNVLDKPFQTGELWVKGDDFFKGYLNNPEETKKMLTEDGWLKTGDLFYRDDRNYYFFRERKRLLIRYCGLWIPPLILEEVMKLHPQVSEACVVGIPDSERMERPVGVIQRRNGAKIDPEEIFDALRKSLPEHYQLSGGLFFIDAFPVTPSGKINRSKLRDIALSTPTILPK